MAQAPSMTPEHYRWLEDLLKADYETPSAKDPKQYDHPDAYKTVCVVGGGTAGFLAALALRAQLPHLDVCLIESSEIPIIGVGEATIPTFIRFLHYLLQIDVEDFYAKVQPTWKLGIKFDWGRPGEYHFHAPFDWARNNIGILGSIENDQNINSMTVEALMMERDATPLFKTATGEYHSLLSKIPFAYHIDNRRLVAYLHELVKKAGIRYLDRKIAEVVRSTDGERVDHLVTTDGERLAFDFFVDCSGFRSLLLEQTLGSPFVPYASSLFTDRALVFNAPHGGRIKPYTTAHTMPSGWAWNIPQMEEDHLGYVYASAFCDEEQARREARARFPEMHDPHGVVKFRSGRHAEAWKGNVAAVGNAYAFLEPLESTGLFMITLGILRLISLFPNGKHHRAEQQLYNSDLARSWDSLRWFLAIHFKFNHKLSTPFWRAAQEQTDISGIQTMLELFQDQAPLKQRNRRVPSLSEIPFYGVAGLDCILLGQQVPARLCKSAETPSAWQQRKKEALALIDTALPAEEALRVVRQHPELLHQILRDPSGWAQNP